jgi:hypothetical protein
MAWCSSVSRDRAALEVDDADDACVAVAGAAFAPSFALVVGDLAGAHGGASGRPPAETANGEDFIGHHSGHGSLSGVHSGSDSHWSMRSAKDLRREGVRMTEQAPAIAARPDGS